MTFHQECGRKTKTKTFCKFSKTWNSHSIKEVQREREREWEQEFEREHEKKTWGGGAHITAAFHSTAGFHSRHFQNANYSTSYSAACSLKNPKDGSPTAGHLMWSSGLFSYPGGNMSPKTLLVLCLRSFLSLESNMFMLYPSIYRCIMVYVTEYFSLAPNT